MQRPWGGQDLMCWRNSKVVRRTGSGCNTGEVMGGLEAVAGLGVTASLKQRVLTCSKGCEVRGRGCLSRRAALLGPPLSPAFPHPLLHPTPGCPWRLQGACGWPRPVPRDSWKAAWDLRPQPWALCPKHEETVDEKKGLCQEVAHAHVTDKVTFANMIFLI